VKTRDKFLKTAEWLFNKKIITAISDYAKFDLTSYIDSAKLNLGMQLNKEWIKGISSSGNITSMDLVGIYPLQDFLVLRSSCRGLLFVKVELSNFSF
jgi:hypothetical protein